MKVLERVQSFPGKVGFYYQNLVTGKTCASQEQIPFFAASVIKLPIMIEAFRQFEAGLLDPKERVLLHDADKMPSCGVLTYLQDGLAPTLLDLVTLAIIVSDNTATNLLIDRLTMKSVNRMLDDQGMHETRLRRKLFDKEASARGLENTVTPLDVGKMLEAIYHEKLVSPTASKKMLSILCNQQLNKKMPFLFTDGIRIAHKTGEDSGITHDVGIVLAEEPFVLCFLGNEVDPPAFERMMQEITWELAHA